MSTPTNPDEQPFYASPQPPAPQPPAPQPPAPQPAYGYAPQPGFPTPYAAKPKTNGMALASMILGILGITAGLCLIFFPVMPILAVIFGHIGLTQTRNTGAPGRGYAIAGLVTGYIGIALAVLWLIAVAIGTFTSPVPTF
ncbi:MAG: hypothetical protein RL134_1151 [Actinomycetota bacterium]|jgi:hypothetical protein